MYRVDSTVNNHTIRNLYKIMVMATSVVGVMKMGNIVLRARLKPTHLAFPTSVLPLLHVGSLTSPLFPRPPPYAAPCIRGQYRLLHSFSPEQLPVN